MYVWRIHARTTHCFVLFGHQTLARALGSCGGAPWRPRGSTCGACDCGAASVRAARAARPPRRAGVGLRRARGFRGVSAAPRRARHPRRPTRGARRGGASQTAGSDSRVCVCGARCVCGGRGARRGAAPPWPPGAPLGGGRAAVSNLWPWMSGGFGDRDTAAAQRGVLGHVCARGERVVEMCFLRRVARFWAHLAGAAGGGRGRWRPRQRRGGRTLAAWRGTRWRCCAHSHRLRP